MKIVIDDKIPYLKGAFEPFAETLYLPGNKINVLDVKNADALITRTRTKCDENLLKNSLIKFIATATIGFDHIDINYCRKSDIIWTNAEGCNSGSVQQYLNSTLFWIEKNYNLDLKKRTIGIVGVGNVGIKVAKSAISLDMKVLLNDPPKAPNNSDYVDFDFILENADIITFHTPLVNSGSNKTFHLLDAKALEKLGQRQTDIFIINTSRGEVIDNLALLNALEKYPNLHAIIDVWENEPKINLDLLEKVDIATSHIAGYSAEGKSNGTMMSVQAISKFFNLPLNNWQPNIPNGPNINFYYDQNKSIDNNLRELHLQSYDIAFDSNILKSNPENFEENRGNYRIRREMKSFTINGERPNKFDDLVHKLSQ
ncbi:MAG: 4-phosphoerythronate dehydrogenase [Lentisphaeria bacterium]